MFCAKDWRSLFLNVCVLAVSAVFLHKHSITMPLSLSGAVSRIGVRKYTKQQNLLRLNISLVRLNCAVLVEMTFTIRKGKKKVSWRSTVKFMLTEYHLCCASVCVSVCWVRVSLWLYRGWVNTNQNPLSEKILLWQQAQFSKRRKASSAKKWREFAFRPYPHLPILYQSNDNCVCRRNICVWCWITVAIESSP